jgi:hypothetical protein
MIFESSSVGDTSCDCLALLAALDSQGFQGQLQGAVTAQQQRAHTLGLQQETHSQVLQLPSCLSRDLFSVSSLSGHVRRVCCCGCCAQLQCHGIQSELGQEGVQERYAGQHLKLNLLFGSAPITSLFPGWKAFVAHIRPFLTAS